MDLKEWLSSSGIAFANTSWKKPPAYPYGVYLDDATTRGADDRLCIRDHVLQIELYAELEKSLDEAETKVEALFVAKAFEFEHTGRVWIESERHWQSTYQLSFTEKYK